MSNNKNETCIGKRLDKTRTNNKRTCLNEIKAYCPHCDSGLCKMCYEEPTRHRNLCYESREKLNLPLKIQSKKISVLKGHSQKIFHITEKQHAFLQIVSELQPTNFSELFEKGNVCRQSVKNMLKKFVGLNIIKKGFNGQYKHFELKPIVIHPEITSINFSGGGDL